MAYRITCVLVAASACVLAAARPGRSAEFLGGLEQWQYEAGLENVTTPADTHEYTAHHAVVAGVGEWSPNENMKVRLGLGRLSSSIADYDPAAMTVVSEGSDGGLYFQIGASLEQDLAMGGGMLLDVSYTSATVNWDNAGVKRKQKDARTGFTGAYVFGEGERARPYAGIAYNTHKAKELSNGSVTVEYGEEKRFSLLAGVRVRTSTFVGLIELSLNGEWGIRTGLLFGF